MHFRSVFLDVDSTLVTIEGLLEIAKKKGFNHDIEEITRQGNDGEMSFSESLHRRLEVIRPTQTDMTWLSDWYVEQLVPGAKDLVKTLHEHDIAVFLLTGSYMEALVGLQKTLNINQEHCYALHVEFDSDGSYIGIDLQQPLVQTMGKRIVIEKVQPPRRIAMIGDGSTDLETKDTVDLFIGFGGVVKREKVEENADIFVESSDLREVLRYIIE